MLQTIYSGLYKCILWKPIRDNTEIFTNSEKNIFYGMQPMLVQTDCGTENGILAALQCSLAGEVAVHRYPSSHANQRVENWWSHSKRGYTAWVIDFFKALVAEGKLSLGNHLQMECVF